MSVTSENLPTTSTSATLTDDEYAYYPMVADKLPRLNDYELAYIIASLQDQLQQPQFSTPAPIAQFHKASILVHPSETFSVTIKSSSKYITPHFSPPWLQKSTDINKVGAPFNVFLNIDVHMPLKPQSFHTCAIYKYIPSNFGKSKITIFKLKTVIQPDPSDPTSQPQVSKYTCSS
jgi:hypothetical protein